MSKRIFITGTDTDVGKTYFSCGLLAALNNLGKTTVALKPVATGCHVTTMGLQNQDALLLQQTASIKLPYNQVNPYAFRLPIAPSIAASYQNISLAAQTIAAQCNTALAFKADYCIVEGAGGWLVPLNATETMADVAKLLKAKIILVVALRLGCLNHALLTVQAIKAAGFELIGWVANQVSSDFEYWQANSQLLANLIPATFLGIITYQGKVEQQLELTKIITF